MSSARKFDVSTDDRPVTRILLVDGHALVREGLASVLQREPDLCICGEAQDRRGALEAVAALRPDLAIVDLALKQSDGLELIKDIHARFPKVRILVVTMQDELLYAERALRGRRLRFCHRGGSG